MNKKTVFFLLATSISILCMSCCSRYVDSLDAVKEFRADDPYFKASLRGFHFISETQSVDAVDTLFRTMVKDNGLPVDASACSDGVYIGETPPDAFDYRHIAKIEIKDGKIISIDYDEIKGKDHSKKEDESYNKEMGATGTPPSVAYPNYEKQLIEKQNILEIDAMTGATYSVHRMRLAVTVALMKAELKSRKRQNVKASAYIA